MTSRQAHRAPLRRRPFVPKTADVKPRTSTRRQTILSPRPGYRIRLIRVKVLQAESDGRHLCELYFGSAGNLIADPSKGIDILAVPDLGTASTRIYPKNEGPRGLRGEPLSLRWRGSSPTKDHKLIIEYSEEA